MKRIFITIGIMAVLFWANYAAAQSYSDFQNSETTNVTESAVTESSLEVQENAGGLIFFRERATFTTACPNLPLEDFEGSNVPPNTARACSGTLNSLTNDACYSPGDILAGISLSDSYRRMVVLTPYSYGVQSTVVGPNFFAANLDMAFPDNDVTAVGMDLLDPVQQTTLDVAIFGIGDVLLGRIRVLSGLKTGNFLGIRSDQIITHISFTQVAGGGGELVDNVTFGRCEMPVDIDIKPGSYPNCMNINGSGVIPVAVLGKADFDVTRIDVNSLAFAGLDVRIKGNGIPQCSVADVSGDFTSPEGAPDGYPDLVCQFVDDPSTWSPDDGKAALTGKLLDGTTIRGTDTICIVP